MDNDPLRATLIPARRLRELLPRRGDLTAMRRQPRQDLVAGLTVAIIAMNGHMSNRGGNWMMQGR